jgi:hypothetical protein
MRRRPDSNVSAASQVRRPASYRHRLSQSTPRHPRQLTALRPRGRHDPNCPRPRHGRRRATTTGAVVTDRPTRRPRWAATVLAAPGAAAVFGAATAWSLHTAPATQVKPPATGRANAPAAATNPDAAVPALQRSAAANAAQVTRLNRLLAQLRAQLKSLDASSHGTTPGAASGAVGDPATAAGSANPPVQTPAAAAPSPAPTPSAPAPVPSSAPPPPAQTSTGASG